MFNFIACWRREREAVRELSRLTDHDLADLGIARSNLGGLAREAEPRPVAESAARLAPAWGAHLRRSVTA